MLSKTLLDLLADRVGREHDRRLAKIPDRPPLLLITRKRTQPAATLVRRPQEQGTRTRAMGATILEGIHQ